MIREEDPGQAREQESLTAGPVTQGAPGSPAATGHAASQPAEPAGAEDETRKIITASHGVAARNDETRKVAPFALGGRRPNRLPVRFGDWLVRRELITRQDLYAALERSYQRNHTCRVGDALVELGAIDRESLEQEARAFLAFTSFTVTLPAERSPLEAIEATATDSEQPFDSLDDALASMANANER